MRLLKWGVGVFFAAGFGAPGAFANTMIVLPDSIPAQCVIAAATRYRVPEMVLLAIVKQESGGVPSAIGKNRNGSYDLGLAQLNTKSWVPYLYRHYGIDPLSLIRSPCQALMAQAYVLRRIANNECHGELLWCAVGRYHSPTPDLQRKYVVQVYQRYLAILARGKF